jgi:cobalt/nickel transport protein
MKRAYWYIIGFAVVVLICVSAFLISPGGGFGGSDDQGGEKIQEISPGYEPWFQSLWTPPDETASLLFAVQAAIGASIIGFFIGNERGKRVSQEKMKKVESVQSKAVKQDLGGTQGMNK